MVYSVGKCINLALTHGRRAMDLVLATPSGERNGIRAGMSRALGGLMDIYEKYLLD
jgi:hypothetical protein